MATPRHRILTWRMVVAALLVGVVLAVVSVPVAAVAIGLHNPSSHRNVLVEYGHADGHVTVVERHDYATGTIWVSMSGPEGMNVGIGSVAGSVSWRQTTFTSRPAITRTELDGTFQAVIHGRMGVPFEAAHCTSRRPSNPSQSRFVGRWGPTVFGREWSIPYLPLWPGLLANTLFYAALAMTPMALLRWRRTRRRRARGLCVGCGYELGEGVSVCPECGLATGTGTLEPT